jgi:hypothetical protein
MSLDKENESLISATAVKMSLKSMLGPNLRIAVDQKKREELKRLVKQKTKCEHSAIYSQITFICRRLAMAYEDNKITAEQAMNLIFEAHEQLSHKGLPRDVVVVQLHKRLDKIENNSKSQFGIVMANTNSSVHMRRREGGQSGKDSPDEENGAEEILGSEDKYSESYWADVI